MLVRPIVKAIVGKITGAIREAFYSREGFSNNVLNLPLLHDRYGTTDATLSRASAGTVTDFEGIVRTVLPEEFRFQGARRVENSIPSTGQNMTLVGGWSVTFNGAGTVTNATDEGDGSYRIQLSLNGGLTSGDIAAWRYNFDYNANQNATRSVWLKSNNGLEQVLTLNYSDATQAITVPGDDIWRRYAIAETFGLNGNNGLFLIGLRGNSVGSLGLSNSLDLLAKMPQVEDTTHQSNRNPGALILNNDAATSGADIPVRYFDKHSSNYVDGDGVVHNGLGVESESTNHHPYSFNASLHNTGGNLVPPVLATATVGGYTIEDNDVSQLGFVYGNTIVGQLTGETLTAVWWIHKTEHTGDPIVELRTTAANVTAAGFDVRDGTFIIRAGSGTCYVESEGDWWIVYLEAVGLTGAWTRPELYPAVGSVLGAYSDTAVGTKTLLYSGVHHNTTKEQLHGQSLIETAADPVTRYGPTPEGSRGDLLTTLDGLLIEEESTNGFHYSNDLTAGSIVSLNITGTDYKTLTVNAGSGYYYMQSSTISATTEDVTTTFTIQQGTATGTVNFRIRNSTSTETFDTLVDFDAVSFPYSFETTHTFTSAGGIHVSVDNRQGGATNSSGTIIIEDIQVEVASYSTSLIPTSGVAVTRLSDDCQTDWVAGLVNDFVIGCTFKMPLPGGGFNYRRPFSINYNGTSIPRIELVNYDGGTYVSKKTTAEGTNNAFYGVLTNSAYCAIRQSSTQGLSIFVEGVLRATVSAAIGNLAAPAVNLLKIGAQYNNAAYLNGTIKNFNIRSGDLPDWEVLGEPSPIGILPVFHALTADPVTKEMVGVKTGVGDLSVVCATPHHALDHEDVYREFPVNSPVWGGGRVVENLIISSEDLTDAAWYLTGSVPPTNIDFETVQFAASTSSRIRQTFSGAEIGKHYIFTADIKSPIAGEIIELKILRNDGASIVTVPIITTSEYIRYSVNISVTQVGDIIAELSPGDISAPLVNMIKAHFEESTGRLDIATPSEYIATTSAAVTKVFACKNGNTVLDNVVTEKKGNALAELPYLDYVPAATNSCLQSRAAFNSAIWIKSTNFTYAHDEAGIDGIADTAATFSDPNTGTYGNIYQDIIIPDDSSPCVFVWDVKKDSDVSRFPTFSARFLGGTELTGELWLNTMTGATQEQTGSVFDAYEVVDNGDWWKILIQLSNNGTGNVTARHRAYPARGSVFGTTATATTGSIISGNCETHLNKTIAEVRGLPPIFTEGSAVSIVETNYSFDIANHSDLSGLWYCEYQPSVSSVEQLSANYGIIGNVSPIYTRSDGFRSADGTTTIAKTVAWAANDDIKLASIYGYGFFDLNVDGVYGGKVAYDGAFTSPTGTLDILTSQVNPCKLRNIERYNIPLYNTGTYIIDDLMAALSAPNDIIDLTVGEG